MATTAKLRRLTTAKGLTPAELELINKNWDDIEFALNTVGAITPGPGAPGTPSGGGIGVSHHILSDLNTFDDHLRYLLMEGRLGGQIQYGGLSSTDTLKLIGNTGNTQTGVWPNQPVDLLLAGNLSGQSPGIIIFNRAANNTANLAIGLWSLLSNGPLIPTSTFPNFGIDGIGQVFVGTYSPSTNPLTKTFTIHGSQNWRGGTLGAGGGAFRDISNTFTDGIGTGPSNEPIFGINLIGGSGVFPEAGINYGKLLFSGNTGLARGSIQISTNAFASSIFRILSANDLVLGGLDTAINGYVRKQGGTLTLDFANIVGLPGGLTGFANPTGTVGLSAVNGSATTAMRSDAAPPLSQAIQPTWTNPHIFSKKATFSGEGTTNANVLLSSGAAPTSPAIGDIWNDSTQKSFIGYPDGVKQTLDGTLFTQTASRTRDTSASENTLFNTGIGTLTVPADWFTPGKTLILVVSGYYGCLASATMRLRAKLTDTTPTTVTVADTTAGTLVSSATNKAFSLAVIITCRTVSGASSTGQCEMLTYFENNASFPQTPNTTTFIFDASKANTIDLTELWGASSATNTITVSNAVLKVVN